jgi:transposase
VYMALDSKNKQPACSAVVTKRFYDKRLIKKIVKEVEEDLPRSEALAIYGMSSSTLYEWMLKYGSDTYLASKKPRFTSDSDKRTVLRAIDSGMSIQEAKVVFGIHPVTIRGWAAKLAKNDELTDCKSVVMSKHEIKSEVNDEIKELKKALALSELKVAGLNTLIDIAEEQLKIDIRKKSGARQLLK